MKNQHLEKNVEYKNKYYKYKNKYYKLVEKKKLMKGGLPISNIFAIILSVLAVVGFFTIGYYNRDKISKWFDDNYKLLSQRQQTSRQQELAERKKQEIADMEQTKIKKDLENRSRGTLGYLEALPSIGKPEKDKLTTFSNEFNSLFKTVPELIKNPSNEASIIDIIAQAVILLAGPKNPWVRKGEGTGNAPYEREIRTQFSVIFLHLKATDDLKKEVFHLYLFMREGAKENQITGKAPWKVERDPPETDPLHYLLDDCPFTIAEELIRLKLIAGWDAKEEGWLKKPDNKDSGIYSVDYNKCEISIPSNILMGYDDNNKDSHLFDDSTDLDLNESWITWFFEEMKTSIEDITNLHKTAPKRFTNYNNRKTSMELIINAIKEKLDKNSDGNGEKKGIASHTYLKILLSKVLEKYNILNRRPMILYTPELVDISSLQKPGEYSFKTGESKTEGELEYVDPKENKLKFVPPPKGKWQIVGREGREDIKVITTNYDSGEKEKFLEHINKVLPLKAVTRQTDIKKKATPNAQEYANIYYVDDWEEIKNRLRLEVRNHTTFVEIEDGKGQVWDSGLYPWSGWGWGAWEENRDEVSKNASKRREMWESELFGKERLQKEQSYIIEMSSDGNFTFKNVEWILDNTGHNPTGSFRMDPTDLQHAKDIEDNEYFDSKNYKFVKDNISIEFGNSDTIVYPTEKNDLGIWSKKADNYNGEENVFSSEKQETIYDKLMEGKVWRLKAPFNSSIPDGLKEKEFYKEFIKALDTDTGQLKEEKKSSVNAIKPFDLAMAPFITDLYWQKSKKGALKVHYENELYRYIAQLWDIGFYFEKTKDWKNKPDIGFEKWLICMKNVFNDLNPEMFKTYCDELTSLDKLNRIYGGEEQRKVDESPEVTLLFQEFGILPKLPTADLLPHEDQIRFLASGEDKKIVEDKVLIIPIIPTNSLMPINTHEKLLLWIKGFNKMYNRNKDFDDIYKDYMCVLPKQGKLGEKAWNTTEHTGDNIFLKPNDFKEGKDYLENWWWTTIGLSKILEQLNEYIPDSGIKICDLISKIIGIEDGSFGKSDKTKENKLQNRFLDKILESMKVERMQDEFENNIKKDFYEKIIDKIINAILIKDKMEGEQFLQIRGNDTIQYEHLIPFFLSKNFTHGTVHPTIEYILKEYIKGGFQGSSDGLCLGTQTETRSIFTYHKFLELCIKYNLFEPIKGNFVSTEDHDSEEEESDEEEGGKNGKTYDDVVKKLQNKFYNPGDDEKLIYGCYIVRQQTESPTSDLFDSINNPFEFHKNLVNSLTFFDTSTEELSPYIQGFNKDFYIYINRNEKARNQYLQSFNKNSDAILKTKLYDNIDKYSNKSYKNEINNNGPHSPPTKPNIIKDEILKDLQFKNHWEFSIHEDPDHESKSDLLTLDDKYNVYNSENKTSSRADTDADADEERRPREAEERRQREAAAAAGPTQMTNFEPALHAALSIVHRKNST